MAWTEERIALLKQYWTEGSSASQIAEQLGEGLSRNAVIGKAHRLGLAARPSPLKTGEPKKAAEPKAPKAEPKVAAAPAAPKVATPKAPPAPKVAAVKAPPPVPLTKAEMMPLASVTPMMPIPRPVAAPRVKGQKVTLLDLNDRICKWPIGHPDEAGFHFCGSPVNVGFPYCQEHCLVAYQAQMPRRDRPGGPSRPFGPNLPRPR